MATTQTLDGTAIGEEVSHRVRDHWWLYVLEGALLLLLGMIAMIAPAIASFAATIFFGWILLFSGGVGLVASFRSRRAPAFVWSLLSAVVALAAGVLLLGWPVSGTLSLTFVLICFLVADGVLSIVFSIEHRKALTARWGWMLFSGILDLSLAGLLIVGLPGTAFWALGLLLGIRMLFAGWALIFLGFGARTASAT